MLKWLFLVFRTIREGAIHGTIVSPKLKDSRYHKTHSRVAQNGKPVAAQLELYRPTWSDSLLSCHFISAVGSVVPLEPGNKNLEPFSYMDDPKQGLLIHSC